MSGDSFEMKLLQKVTQIIFDKIKKLWHKYIFCLTWPIEICLASGQEVCLSTSSPTNGLDLPTIEPLAAFLLILFVLQKYYTFNYSSL